LRYDSIMFLSESGRSNIRTRFQAKCKGKAQTALAIGLHFAVQ
jgi:hypothetical protein